MFKDYLASSKQHIEQWLGEVLTSPNREFKPLYESMNYSLMQGGKRIRPILSKAVLEMLHKDPADYKEFLCAMECIHTYSLVHDDLPAMDNDDYRWGKHTNHKVFGQDVAVLTGDAMLTLAFEVLSKANINDTLKVNLIQQFANYSGAMGMIAGQVYDVKQKNYQVDANYLKLMHSLKTGRLIELPLDFACKIARKESDLDYIRSFGKELGIAYQIKDDILDIEGDFLETGKESNDEENHKMTYPSLYGLEKSKEMLSEYLKKANEIIEKYFDGNELFVELTDYFGNRKK